MAAVKLSDIMEALELNPEETCFYLDKQTGKVIFVGEEVQSALDSEDDTDDLPDWLQEAVEEARAVKEDTEERYIALPDRHEIDEGSIVGRFIDLLDDIEISEDLHKAFQGRGAFRRFKDTLIRHNIEKQWYAFRDKAFVEFALEWCEDNDIKVINDLDVVE